jgi:uncharacterized protein YpmB
MKRKTGWLWGLALFALVLVGGAVWQVKHLANEVDVRQAADVQTALAESSLEKVTQVYPFVAEQNYTIVEGTDRTGRELMVWVGDRMVRSAYLDLGVDAVVIRQFVARNHPDWRIVRLAPGLYENELAWELFYRQSEGVGETRYGYAYYRFFDGAYMGGHILAR